MIQIMQRVDLRSINLLTDFDPRYRAWRRIFSIRARRIARKKSESAKCVCPVERAARFVRPDTRISRIRISCARSGVLECSKCGAMHDYADRNRSGDLYSASRLAALSE